MLGQVTVIAFDLDDTLWPCAPVLSRAEAELYDWLGANYPRITQSFNPAQMVEQRLQFSASEPRYAIDLSALRREFLQHLGNSHGYDGTRVGEQGFEVFFKARQQIEFYDDVLPCLQRLKQRYRLGAISNGNASIEHVGLGPFIEHSVSAEELQVAKPDPRIFGELAKRFATPAAQIVYVGDHPVYDVVGPRDAGYRTIWLNREGLIWPSELAAPDFQAADLHELSALLKV